MTEKLPASYVKSNCVKMLYRIQLSLLGEALIYVSFFLLFTAGATIVTVKGQRYMFGAFNTYGSVYKLHVQPIFCLATGSLLF